MPPEQSLFDLLQPDERRELLVASRRRKFRRGEVIFHEGDPGDSLHVIEKGHVAIRVTTSMGDVATLTVLGPDDAFGEGALLAPDSRRTASASAVESAETRSIVKDEFERIRRDHPAIERFLTQALAEQVRRLSGHLVEALYVPADKRVLRRVLALCASYGKGVETVTIPVTQEDLAAMAGTTRPTANRVLKAVEEAGVLKVGRGRIEVIDQHQLARMTG